MRCTSSGVLFEAVYVASHAVISCQPHACISQPILNASEGNRHVADTHWHGGLPDEEPASYTACPEYRGNVKIAWCVRA